MALKKIETPVVEVRMWVADVPLPLRNQVDTLRRKRGYNKQVCMIKMMELFLETAND